jgi:hypothetical protein
VLAVASANEEGIAMSGLNAQGGAESADRALANVDAGKRETLRKLILGAAFVVPIVASFSVDGLVSRAHANPNTTYSGKR